MSRSLFGCCVTALLLFGLAALPGCGGEVTGVNAQSVAALAGAAGGPGFFDGMGTFVRFSFPSGVTAIGTDLFVADNNNHVIRRIDTTTGAVTTLAGTFGVKGADDGTGAAARFNSPTGIVAAGTILFVCDTGNHTIRRIVSTSGAVTTLAGTPGSSGFADNNAGPGGALFSSPRGIAADGGSNLYVADTGNHRIRRVTFAGATFTSAGSGTSGAADNVGALASFSSPEGVAFLTSDVYVADTGNHTIRRITSPGTAGNVTTFAGTAGLTGFVDNVTGNAARFFSPSSLAAIGTDLFVADTGNQVLRKIDAAAFVTTLAGGALVAGFADGTGAAARFSGPKGVGTDGASIFVADTQNHAIRTVTTGGAVATAAGNPPRAGTTDGTGAAARFRAPGGAAVVGDNVFVVDTENHAIRTVNAISGVVTTLAGSPGVSGTVDGSGTGARFTNPQGIVAVGTDLYVADSGNHAIRRVTAAGVVTTLAGLPGTPGFVNDTGTAARFNAPRGIATDGASLFVADSVNHAIRKIVIATGLVTTLAGTGAAGYANTAPATFNGPEGVAVIGNNLYVADTGNHAVRKIAPFSAVTPTITTFAGAGPPTAVAGFINNSGTSARFSSPRGITAVGSVLYVADTGNHAVRTISTAASAATFVGTPEAATTRDGDATQALLNAPVGIAGIQGTIYFTDVNENVVRKILF